MRAAGVVPPLPPSPDAAGLAELRDRWTSAAAGDRDARDRGGAELRDFRGILGDEHHHAERAPDARRDAVRRSRAAQTTAARTTAGGCRGAHHAPRTSQRDQGTRADAGVNAVCGPPRGLIAVTAARAVLPSPARANDLPCGGLNDQAALNSTRFSLFCSSACFETEGVIDAAALAPSSIRQCQREAEFVPCRIPIPARRPI